MRKIVFLLSVVLCFAGVASATPTLSIETARIVITSVPPGGTIALIRFSLVGRDSYIACERAVELLVDTDGDGSVIKTYDGSIPGRSLFLVVDWANGSHVTGLPEGFAPGLISRGELHAAKRTLSFDAGSGELLLIRPGVGAWGTRGVDAAPSDEDRQSNWRVEIAAANVTRVLGEVPTPATLEERDLLIAVDADTLRYFLHEVKR